MLTENEFLLLPAGAIMGKGVVINSPEGVYMTDNNIGQQMRWIAKKGYAQDWVIYALWAFYDFDYILSSGQKINDDKNILKLIKCDEETLKRYRK